MQPTQEAKVVNNKWPQAHAGEVAGTSGPTAGLRLRSIRLSVQDLADSSFRKDAHRQSLAVLWSAGAREDQAFIEAVSDREVRRGDIEVLSAGRSSAGLHFGRFRLHRNLRLHDRSRRRTLVPAGCGAKQAQRATLSVSADGA